MTRLSLIVAALFFAPCLSSAQTLGYSADTPVSLSGIYVPQGEIAVDDGAGNITTEQLPFDPTPAEITAFHQVAAGDFLFVLDTAVLVGGTSFRAGEVLHASADGLTSEFDPVSAGLPRGVEVDAVTQRKGNLVLSFDTDVNWNGTFFADEDLMQFDSGSVSLALDGSSVGIASSADIDAVHRIGDSRWALSFDAPGELGGIRFRDQDVLWIDPDNGNWSMAHDASEGVAGWDDAGLDAFWSESLVREDGIFADRFEASP